MAVEPRRLYTYADLQTFPEDNLRREIIDGELFVTAAPRIRHQGVVAILTARLWEYARVWGRGDTIEAAPLPGLSLSVDEILGSPEEEPS